MCWVHGGATSLLCSSRVRGVCGCVGVLGAGGHFKALHFLLNHHGDGPAMCDVNARCAMCSMLLLLLLCVFALRCVRQCGSGHR